MLQYTPPQISDMSSSTLSPFARVKRFSTSQDKQPMPPTPDGESVVSHKRTSRLNEFMSRTRTASLPPRPHTSNGPSSRQRLSTRFGNLKGKGKEKAGLLSPDADSNGDEDYVNITAAASSLTSGKHSLTSLACAHFISSYTSTNCAPVRRYVTCTGALPPLLPQWDDGSVQGYCYFLIHGAPLPTRFRV